ncbi:hypothetical protein RB653_010131 [Dictyostelium firmibasis]|uniref:Uncharacterized protein n=1 Tax=Dictyostelium firmibasis TaxID=79012 RepID=A0AAN7TJM8_9MYCE
MKVVFLIFTILILINFTFANDGFVLITPMGTGDECSTTPYGEGYYLPTGTEITIDNECYQLDFINSSTHLQVQYLGKNCSIEHPPTTIYPMNECVDFKLKEYNLSFMSIISIGDNIPSQSVSYVYYYFSNFCSGPSYQLFFTNGYSNNYSKYLCVNGEPQVYVCTGAGGCIPVEARGCTNENVPMPYRVEC